MAYEIIFYDDVDTGERIEVILKGGSVWLSQRELSRLFGCTKSNINILISKIYNSKIIDYKSTMIDEEIHHLEGKRYINRQLYLYNLDMVMIIGKKINLNKIIKFEEWVSKYINFSFSC